MNFATRVSLALVAALALLDAGCSGNGSPPEQPSNPPAKVTSDESTAPAERPKMTSEECAAKGTLVGDIGDGATQRATYRCPGGKLPLGNVPLGVEGSVCCPR